jgi:hypothetical protein
MYVDIYTKSKRTYAVSISASSGLPLGTVRRLRQCLASTSTKSLVMVVRYERKTQRCGSKFFDGGGSDSPAAHIAATYLGLGTHSPCKVCRPVKIGSELCNNLPSIKDARVEIICELLHDLALNLTPEPAKG